MTNSSKNREHTKDLVAAAELCDQRAEQHKLAWEATLGTERRMNRVLAIVWRERAARLRNVACFSKPYGDRAFIVHWTYKARKGNPVKWEVKK